jgi:hypothetical protein
VLPKLEDGQRKKASRYFLNGEGKIGYDRVTAPERGIRAPLAVSARLSRVQAVARAWSVVGRGAAGQRWETGL